MNALSGLGCRLVAADRSTVISTGSSEAATRRASNNLIRRATGDLT
jgi:hypothetical protein